MCFSVSIHPHLPGSHVFNCPLCGLLWPLPTALCFSPTSLKKMEQEWTHHMDHAEWWRSPGWIQLQRWPLSTSFSLSALLLSGETMRAGQSWKQKGVSVGLRDGVRCSGMVRGETVAHWLPTAKAGMTVASALSTGLLLCLSFVTYLFWSFIPLLNFPHLKLFGLWEESGI